MKISRKVSALIAGLAIAASVHAVDFGGTLDNSTKFSTNDYSTWGLSQQDSLTGWLKVPFNEEGRLYLATEGTVMFKYTSYNLAAKPSYSYRGTIFDIRLFKLGGVFDLGGNLLQLNLGRFFLSDTTGIILAQTSDGVQGVFSSDMFTASVYAGYTGFTNALFSSMNDGPGSTYVADYRKPYYFNSPYIISEATFSAPYLFANQTVGAEVLGMFGTKGLEGSNSGYNRVYLTLFMNGPVLGNLFYTLTSTLAFNSGVSNLSVATLSYYPSFMASSITFNATYASGESGGIKAFQGFTGNTATYAYNEPGYTNLLKLGLSGSLKPTENLYTAIGSDIVFDSGSNFGFRGIQWDATAKYQFFTDLELSLGAKQFLDFKDRANNNFSISLNANLSF